MPDIRYRMYFDNAPATREQLDRVEEITVEQRVDMVWEARFQLPICTDENGKWTGEDEEFLTSFGRVRIEVDGGTGFTPLIDGPIVGTDSEMSSEPGQSAITVHVHDDSVYLNRRDSLSRFDNRLPHEIAAQLFGDIEQLASTEIEETPAAANGLPPVEVQRGTEIQILRKLARCRGMHAYVLPGAELGESIGCFKKFPTEMDGLPPLILLGPDRNLESFHVKDDAQRPTSVEAQELNIADKVVTRAAVKFRDLQLLGKEGALTKESAGAGRVLPPGCGDVREAVRGAAEQASYSFSASGAVMGDCYTGVLSPYRLVTVKGVNRRLCGNYVIEKVTHTLTRAQYSQSFSLLRNAVSEGSGAGLEELAGTIF